MSSSRGRGRGRGRGGWTPGSGGRGASTGSSRLPARLREDDIAVCILSSGGMAHVDVRRTDLACDVKQKIADSKGLPLELITSLAFAGVELEEESALQDVGCVNDNKFLLVQIDREALSEFRAQQQEQRGEEEEEVDDVEYE